MKRVVSRKTPVFLLAGWLCLSAGALSAQNMLPMLFADKAQEYPNKQSGDNAMKSQSYDTAASFYAAYRRKAEQKHDLKAIQDAMECEIGAWLLASHPTQAENVIAEYKKRFPKAEKQLLDLWSADVLLLKNQPAEAKKILLKINSRIPVTDPDKQHTMIALAMAHLMLKEYGDAAKLYGDLVRRTDDDMLKRRFTEYQILMLAEAGNLPETVDLLKNLKMADNIDQRSIDAMRLLNIYLFLKDNNTTGVKEALKEAQEAEVIPSDSFFQLVSSLIGEQLQKRKDYEAALNACRLAYFYSRSTNEAFDALTRMTAMLDDLEKKEEAAALAMTQFDLFKRPATPTEIKLFAAKLFINTGRSAEAMELYAQVFHNESIPQEKREEIFRQIFRYLLTKHDFTNADKLIALYYEKQPEHGAVWFCKAQIAEAKGQLAEAMDLYCKSADCGNEFFKPAVLRAIELSDKLRNHEKVIELVNRFLTAEPKSQVLFYRASAYEALEKTAEALADYHAYSGLPDITQQERIRALFREAALYFAGQDYAEAKKIFRAIYAEKSAPESEAALAGYWSIFCSYRMQNTEAAEQETDELMKRFPESDYSGMA